MTVHTPDSTLPVRRSGLPFLAVLAIAFVAIAVRVSVLGASTGMTPDSAEYLRRIALFAKGKWFFTNLDLGHPLYTVWCGLVHAVIGRSDAWSDLLRSGQIAGVVLAMSAVVPMYWLAQAFLGRTSVAVGCALLYACLPMPVWWAGELMTDAPAVALGIWAFALFARWYAGGASVNLVFGFAVLAIATHFRIATALLGPASAILLVAAMIRRRSWAPVVWSWIFVLVLVAPVLVHQSITSGTRPMWSYFRPSGLNGNTDFSLLTGSPRSMRAWAAARLGFTEIGLGFAALGLLVSLWKHRLVFAILCAWVVPVVVYPLVNKYTAFQMRFLLPAGPMLVLSIGVVFAALLAVGGRRGLVLVSSATMLLAVLFGVRSWPDLRVLQHRTHVSHATASWYAAHADAGSLILTGVDLGNVLLLTDRCTVRLVSVAQYGKWPEPSALALPAVLHASAVALDEERSVFVSRDLVHLRVRTLLETAFVLERAHVFPASTLRNQFDSQLRRMGPQMRKAEDVAIDRIVRRRPGALRALAPPMVRRNGDRLEIVVTVRAAIGHRVSVVLVPHASSVDWTRPETFRNGPFAPDRLAHARRASVPLGRDGRVTVHRRAQVPGRGWVAAGLFSPDGRLVGVSVAAAY